MYFLSGTRKELVNTDHVERFCISEKEDAFLVVASYGRAVPPVTLARYQSMAEAMEALAGLHTAISEDDPSYYMPASTGVYIQPEKPGNGYHGAKHKGHGGS